MRAELMELARGNPVLGFVEADLKSLLGTWFDVDFLELRRITWDTSSAKLLQKLIAYESIYAIANWDDLKNRLASERRCFAYFNPRMPDEPLIFIEVALFDGMAGNIQELLDTEAPLLDPKDADTAIFYSISNARRDWPGAASAVSSSSGSWTTWRRVSRVPRPSPPCRRRPAFGLGWTAAWLLSKRTC